MKFLSGEKRFKKCLDGLKDPDPEKRGRCANELSELGRLSAVPYLKKALSDEDRRVRWRVAYALGELGEAGSDAAFEALISRLKHEPDWNIRRIIVMSLRHWDKRAWKPLIRALDDESEYVRRYAAMTLGFKKVKEAVPKLIKLSEGDSSKDVRDYAKWAVEKISSHPRP